MRPRARPPPAGRPHRRRRHDRRRKPTPAAPPGRRFRTDRLPGHLATAEEPPLGLDRACRGDLQHRRGPRRALLQRRPNEPRNDHAAPADLRAEHLRRGPPGQLLSRCGGRDGPGHGAPTRGGPRLGPLPAGRRHHGRRTGLLGPKPDRPHPHVRRLFGGGHAGQRGGAVSDAAGRADPLAAVPVRRRQATVAGRTAVLSQDAARDGPLRASSRR